MADSTRILDGFFKGIPIRIDSGSVTGGRKTSKKESWNWRLPQECSAHYVDRNFQNPIGLIS